MAPSIPAISVDLENRLNAAIADLSKNTAATNSTFAKVVTELARADIPAQIIPSPTLTIAELREEIKWQGDEFNQIDSKVGIVLGFILIFAGQLLVLFTTKHTDIQPLLNRLQQCPHHLGFGILYLFVAFIGLSLAFGVASRWPRDFQGSAIQSNEPIAPAIKVTVLPEDKVLEYLSAAIANNRSVVREKGRYSKLCNLFAALTLLGIVVIIVGSIHYL